MTEDAADWPADFSAANPLFLTLKSSSASKKQLSRHQPHYP
jgi:hypothetical protein